MWPFLTILLLAALVGLHLWWRGRSRASEAAVAGRLARLEAEQARAAGEHRRRLEVLFDSMIEGVLVLDRTQRIELANRAFGGIFGANIDVRGQTLGEALRLHELSDLVTALNTETTLERELHLTRPVDRFLRINGAAILDAAGERQGSLLVFHDLTRLKRLEGARTEFIANVSHELRTPLSLIKGYCETLLEGAKDNPEVAEKFLRTIDRNARRLELLIDDLLSISELESGQVRLDLQTVALRPLVEKVLGDFKARAGERGIRLENLAADAGLKADAHRLEQVLGNLLDNAIKYGRTDGRVTVSSRTDETGRVEVCVRDDGPGIPPEALERVFERFYRVDKARSREQGGTGLGLAIVKHIVQSHQGRVWARSVPGEGASFFFTMPAAPPDPSQPGPG